LRFQVLQERQRSLASGFFLLADQKEQGEPILPAAKNKFLVFAPSPDMNIVEADETG